MDVLTWIGLTVGGLLILTYFLYTRRNGTGTQLTQAAILFISASGCISGIRLVFFAFTPDLIDLARQNSVDVTHVILGGIALSWVSIMATIDVFKTVPTIVRQRPQAVQHAADKTES